MTTIIPQIFTNLTDYKPSTTTILYSTKLRKPANSFTRKYVYFYHRQGIRLGFESSGQLLHDKDQFDDKINKNKKKRMVLVRFNNLNFNGGGGGKDDGGKSRVLWNLGLAIGLTYLSMTGQLGWILDTIVSIWVCMYAFVFLALFSIVRFQKSIVGMLLLHKVSEFEVTMLNWVQRCLIYA